MMADNLINPYITTCGNYQTNEDHWRYQKVIDTFLPKVETRYDEADEPYYYQSEFNAGVCH